MSFFVNKKEAVALRQPLFTLIVGRSSFVVGAPTWGARSRKFGSPVFHMYPAGLPHASPYKKHNVKQKGPPMMTDAFMRQSL